MVLNLQIFILVSILVLSIAPYLRGQAANTDVYHQQSVTAPVFSPLHLFLVTFPLFFLFVTKGHLYFRNNRKLSTISKVAWQCLNAWMFLLNCFTIIYLGIYGQWSHLHLAVILAQLTCGCVTRRAAPRVTWPAPAQGGSSYSGPGRALRQNQLPRAMDPARWDLRPGLGSGVGTIKSGCWLHSLTPMSKSGIVTCPGWPELAKPETSLSLGE